MITILSILFLVGCFWLTFKVIPFIFGVFATIFFAILQIIGIMLLLPVIGLLCFAVDFFVLFIIIAIIKAII